MASTLITWLLETTPTAIPSLSHTTTRGVSRFAKIRAASKSDASRLSTASRFRAASKTCLTRIMGIAPHPWWVRGSPPRPGGGHAHVLLAILFPCRIRLLANGAVFGAVTSRRGTDQRQRQIVDG